MKTQLKSVHSHAPALPRYDDMCRAITECHRIDEAKDFRDKAEALRAYAKQANNRDAEVQFAEIKVRAEIRCGELLRDMAERGERHTKEQGVSHVATPTLTTLGVSRDESSRFQRIAAVPRDLVEAEIKKSFETKQPVTSAQVRALTRSPEFTAAQRAEHERLWRVLRALEQIAEQDVTPRAWIDALPDYMQSRVTLHLQRARPWLERLFTAWEKRHGKEERH